MEQDGRGHSSILVFRCNEKSLEACHPMLCLGKVVPSAIWSGSKQDRVEGSKRIQKP